MHPKAGSWSPLLSRRQFLHSAALAGGAAALGLACGPRTGAPAAISPDAPPQRVDFAAKAAVSHLKALLSAMPWTVGEAKGFFKDLGLTHELTEFSGGGDTVRGLLLGGNNYALTAPSPSITAFASGEPLRIIGTAYGSTTIVFLVKTDTPYQALRDVAGKKIGFSTAGSNTHFLAIRANRDNQLNAELISVGGIPDSLTALRTGIVDCSWSAEPTPGRFEDEFRVIATAGQIVPKFSEFIITSTEDFLKNRPDVVRAFLAAYGTTQKFIADNPEESARIWGENAGVATDIVAKALGRVAKEGWSLKIDPDMLKTVEASMVEFNQIDRPVDWKTLVVQDFLPPDQRTPLPS